MNYNIVCNGVGSTTNIGRLAAGVYKVTVNYQTHLVKVANGDSLQIKNGKIYVSGKLWVKNETPTPKVEKMAKIVITDCAIPQAVSEIGPGLYLVEVGDLRYHVAAGATDELRVDQGLIYINGEQWKPKASPALPWWKKLFGWK